MVAAGDCAVEINTKNSTLCHAKIRENMCKLSRRRTKSVEIKLTGKEVLYRSIVQYTESQVLQMRRFIILETH